MKLLTPIAKISKEEQRMFKCAGKSQKSKSKKNNKVPAGFARLKDLKKGAFFKTKNTGTCPVLVKGEYVREEGCNKYSCYYYNDTCRERFLKGETVVFIDFEF